MNYDQNKVKSPEHFQLAEKMASEICSFQPHEQNEMVNLIFGQVLQRRQEQIEETAKKLEFLKASVEGITK